MTWEKYSGTMNTRAMSKLAGRAYGIWNLQCQRCANPKNGSYKNYGAKGIRVTYSARDFIGWWLWQFKTKGYKLKKIGVGRIDHSKDYSFENIEMIEHADNAREMYCRTGGNKTVARTPVVLVDDKSGSTHVFASNVLAAKFAKVTPAYICLRKRVPGEIIKRFPYKVYATDDFLSLGGIE